MDSDNTLEQWHQAVASFRGLKEFPSDLTLNRFIILNASYVLYGTTTKHLIN